MKRAFLIGIPLLAFCLAVCPLAMADEDLVAGNPEKSVYYIFGSGSVQGSFAPQETCCYCHGNGGSGTTFGKQAGVPDFTNKEWQTSRSDEELMETMLAGKDKMPSYRGKQTDALMKKLRQVVRNFAKE
ncbi:MAG: c-type cytochrome [Candidatus Bathyanammoxibius sp.]